MQGNLINLSGHALSKETTRILEQRFNKIINMKPIDFDFEGDIEKQIISIINSIPCRLDGTIPITIIPPGQSTLSILLASYLHGALGHFPSLCYLEINSDGLYLPKTQYSVNTQSIRSAGRKWRTSIFTDSQNSQEANI